MKAALIGWGAIGKVIGDAILAGKVPGMDLVAVAEIRRPTNELCELSLKWNFALVNDVAKLLKFSPDIVIEAAGQEVVREFAAMFLKAQKNLMIMSVGALADQDFLDELLRLAQNKGARIIIPSGAIGGLDAIKSASVGCLTDVTIRNIKPPAALAGAPFIAKNNIDLKSIKCRTQIYEGFAEEAAKEFPQNVNVAVALGLAGIGVAKTKVIVVVDPAETCNVHEIVAKGDFGEVNFTVRGLPSPQNPRTSYLASLSAIATLQNIGKSIHVGT